MLLRTHANAHFALTRGALFEFSSEGVQRVRELPETESLSSLAPSGRVVWQFPQLRRIDCATAEVRAFASVLCELLALDDDLVAGVRIDAARTQKATLVMGRPPARPDESWSLELPLESGLPIRKVDWPDELIWASRSELPWVRNQSFVPKGYQSFDRPIRLGISPWGIGIVGLYSGLVTFLRTGSNKLDGLWRLPAQEEVSIDVWPTAEGFCCTYVVEGRDAAVILFDAEGKVCAQVQGWGMQPALPLGEKSIVCWDDDEDELLLLDAKDLSEHARILEPRRPRAMAVCQAPPRVALLADSLIVYEVDKHRLWECQELSLEEPAPLPQESSAIPFVLGRSDEPSAVGFPVLKKPSPAWKLETAQPGRVELWVRSLGQATQGLTVILSGPAIETALLRPLRAHCGKFSTAFEAGDGPAFRTRLSSVALQQGVIFPFEPEPVGAEESAAAQAALAATHFAVELELEGLRAGQELLTVSLFAADKGTPLRWTRPLSVRDSGVKR